jgi:hypothetical protein
MPWGRHNVLWRLTTSDGRWAIKELGRGGVDTDAEWHGNVFLALQTITHLQLCVDCGDDSPEQRKLSKAVTEFDGYIQANATSIPNYGERYRNGEAISSAFVVSAVNQVVSKRMDKKQQMRWTPRGAHLLLQVRSRVLNDDLAADFRRWLPAFVTPSPPTNAATAA